MAQTHEVRVNVKQRFVLASIFACAMAPAQIALPRSPPWRTQKSMQGRIVV